MWKVVLFAVFVFLIGSAEVFAQLGDPEWGMSVGELVEMEGPPTSRGRIGGEVVVLRYFGNLAGWGADVSFLVGARGLFETRTEWLATSRGGGSVAQRRLVEWVGARMRRRESGVEGRRVYTEVAGKQVAGREWRIGDERVTFFFGDERTWDLVRHSVKHAPEGIESIESKSEEG